MPESGCCEMDFLCAVNMRSSHLLINKAAWVYDKAEWSQAGIPSRDTGQERQDCRDMLAATQETTCQQTGKSHGHVVIHRLKETD